MKFLHPEFLYYMLPPLIVLFVLLLTQKEPQASYFSDEVMQRLRVVANTLSLKARNALFFLAGIFMIIAMAEPVIPNGKVELEQKSADIVLALDISNSMLANDLYPNRLEFAKRKAIDFIKKLKQDRVGVVAFAKGSYLVSPLSFDHEAVAFLLKNLETTSITEQGTDFMALLQTVAASSKHSKQKYLLIFTDGGDKSDFSKEIAYAKEHGITVFVLGVGTTRGAPIKLPKGGFMKYNGKMVITKLNEHIADLATKTGGVYIQASNSPKDIGVMYEEMQSVVEKKRIKAQRIEDYIPLFYFPLGAAMLTLLVAFGSMTKRTKVEVPSLFLLPLLLFGVPQLKAGILDFMEIQEAKEDYLGQKYEKAAKRFERYAKDSQKASAFYDAGNAYYKAKKYDKAAQMYKKVHTKDAALMAHTFHNLGNTYAAQGKYEEAIEAYKDALKLKNDPQTKENLKRVEELLRKKKQKQQHSDQNNKQQQNSGSSKQQHSKEGKQGENSQKQQQGSQKQSASKQNRQQNKSNANDRFKQQKNTKESKAQTRSKQQEQKKENKKQKGSKGSLKKLSEDKEAQKGDEASSGRIVHKEKQMSDEEEKKWLKELNNDSRTFMYMMRPAKKGGYEDENEKPW